MSTRASATHWESTRLVPTSSWKLSDSSIGYDRGEKAGLFARAGIPEYWILNIRRRRLEERRDPDPDPDSPFGFLYRSIRLLHEGELASSLFAPDSPIRVADLLGPAVPA